MKPNRQRTIPFVLTPFVLTALLILLFANFGAAQALSIVQCAPFEGLTLGTTYSGGGQTFAAHEIGFRTARFQNGAGFVANQVTVENGGKAAGSGNELAVNNINVALDISATTVITQINRITLMFGETGGNLNIMINGMPRNFANFEDINGKTIGGAEVTVLGDGDGQGTGSLIVRGRIFAFAVGGQELWIDNFCISKTLDGDPNDPSDPDKLRIPDLGDAPDSSNHPAVPMAAYPAIPANYPTVFDPASGLPQGPKHQHAGVFHLGMVVSAERDADQLPDIDGVPNIDPVANLANQDRFDDGVRPPTWSLADCQTTTVQVQVFIAPQASILLSPTQGIGYLNIWLDANRDGDWADVKECTQPGANPKPAPEHVVIDFPVNTALLGAGVHLLNVTSNLIPWPADRADKPAWVRVTLSDRPSDKSAGGGNYGDGRGYADPFRSGETEDYLWRPANDPNNAADVVIYKRGAIVPNREGDGSVIAWAIEYGNAGSGDAAEVKIKDDLSQAGNSNALQIRSVPPVPYLVDGDSVTFNVGTLPPGVRGHILIETRLPNESDASTIFTNTVGITATVDSDPTNNRAQATTAIVLRSPIIVAPGNGTTCQSTFDVTGLAIPGSEVDLYVDDTLVGTATAGEHGRWSLTVGPLADGSHDLYAIARKGGMTSEPSRITNVIVDSTLAWNPLSLRFSDSRGHSHRPVDSEGRTDAEGWQVRLRRNESYTVSLQICCEDPTSVGLLMSNGVTTTTVAMNDDNSDKIYEGVFITPLRHQELSFALVVKCGDTETQSHGSVLIDPEGQVYDVKTGALLNGSTVSCMEEQTSAASDEATFALWQAEVYGQINPQLTEAEGHFSFFTPVGIYQLNVNRDGYQAYRSVVIAVVDEAVVYDVPLTPNLDKPADFVVTISASGFEPAYLEVAAGSVVEWVNVDGSGHSSSLLKQTVAADANTVGEYLWDSGQLNTSESYKFQLDELGSYSYSDRSNPALSGTIVVKAIEEANQKVFLPVVTR